MPGPDCGIAAGIVSCQGPSFGEGLLSLTQCQFQSSSTPMHHFTQLHVGIVEASLFLHHLQLQLSGQGLQRFRRVVRRDFLRTCQVL